MPQVRCLEPLRLSLRITKGPEGRLVVVPEVPTEQAGSIIDADDEDDDEDAPYTVAERSVHEASMPLRQWLQSAAAHLRYEIARNPRLPAEARGDAISRAETLEGFIEGRRAFVVSVNDPTGESHIGE